MQPQLKVYHSNPFFFWITLILGTNQGCSSCLLTGIWSCTCLPHFWRNCLLVKNQNETHSFWVKINTSLKAGFFFHSFSWNIHRNSQHILGWAWFLFINSGSLLRNNIWRLSKRVAANLVSRKGGAMFQRTGTITEETHLLYSFRWNSLADGTTNMALLQNLMEWVEVNKERQSLEIDNVVILIIR